MNRSTIPVHEYDETGRKLRTKRVVPTYFPGCVEVWTDDAEVAMAFAQHRHKVQHLDGDDHDLTREIVEQ